MTKMKKKVHTLKEALAMKDVPHMPFGNLHDFTAEYLFDQYYAHLNGEERLEALLEDWDDEGKAHWLREIRIRERRAEEDCL